MKKMALTSSYKPNEGMNGKVDKPETITLSGKTVTFRETASETVVQKYGINFQKSSGTTAYTHPSLKKK